MNRDKYEDLKASRQPVPTYIDINEVGGTDRTLLYGYTVERHDWHVYLQNGMIFFLEVQTSLPKNPISFHMSSGISADLAVPNKRVYPESTDYHFARLVQSKGVDIPFLPFDEERYKALLRYPFHGPILMGDCPVWDRENGIVHIWGKENGI